SYVDSNVTIHQTSSLFVKESQSSSENPPLIVNIHHYLNLVLANLTYDASSASGQYDYHQSELNGSTTQSTILFSLLHCLSNLIAYPWTHINQRNLLKQVFSVQDFFVDCSPIHALQASLSN